MLTYFIIYQQLDKNKKGELTYLDVIRAPKIHLIRRKGEGVVGFLQQTRIVLAKEADTFPDIASFRAR